MVVFLVLPNISVIAILVYTIMILLILVKNASRIVLPVLHKIIVFLVKMDILSTPIPNVFLAHITIAPHVIIITVSFVNLATISMRITIVRHVQKIYKIAQFVNQIRIVSLVTLDISPHLIILYACHVPQS